MPTCYVVFYGKTPGIYLTWHDCSKLVLGVRNAIYKKYSNYEQAVRDYQAAMRDVNPSHGAVAPHPYDLVPNVAPPQTIAPSNGDGKPGCSKNVFIISTCYLVVWSVDEGGQYLALLLPHVGL